MLTTQAYEDIAVALFHLRDPRGGQGRVSEFQRTLRELHVDEPDLVMSLLPLIPEYGCWADLFQLAADAPAFKDEVLRLAQLQLLEDETRVLCGEPVSIFAKWVPDEKKRLGRLATEFAYYLVRGFSPRPEHSKIMASYRRRINRLNRLINPVEIYECAGRWDEINPARVGAGAIRVKHAAYLNQQLRTGAQRSTDEKRIRCAERFRAFFEAGPPAPHPMYAPSSTRYDAVRAVVREWAEGGWRI
jgi:hypothetical protein